MRVKLWVAAIAVVVFISSTEAYAALNAYLTVRSKQGPIQGSVTQKGREGKIAVIETRHEIQTPPNKLRAHGLFTVVKEVDKSSPLLYKAAVAGETFPEWELQFWTPQGGSQGFGAERQHYSVTLKNARIASIKFVQPNTRDPETRVRAEYEEIAFSYEHITWTWKDGGIAASDQVP
jgi:type VI secretion system secreted protein Hcp